MLETFLLKNIKNNFHFFLTKTLLFFGKNLSALSRTLFKNYQKKLLKIFWLTN